MRTWLLAVALLGLGACRPKNTPGDQPAEAQEAKAGYHRLVFEIRRLNPRLEIELTANYQISSDNDIQSGTVANLSAGGAGVISSVPIAARTLLENFRFSLPKDGARQPLESSAVVVHARPFRDDQGSIAYCFGVHFLGFETEDFEHLRTFVLDRLAEAPD